MKTIITFTLIAVDNYPAPANIKMRMIVDPHAMIDGGRQCIFEEEKADALGKIGWSSGSGSGHLTDCAIAMITERMIDVSNSKLRFDGDRRFVDLGEIPTSLPLPGAGVGAAPP